MTPANAMLAVELTHIADVLDSAGQFPNISSLARNVSARVTSAIWNTTVWNDLVLEYTKIANTKFI